jgi:phospholipase/carboxylesterase
LPSSDLLPRVEIEPTVAGAPATVLWLHGLGADGHDFEPIVPYLGLPWARFVFPHAPARPVTIFSRADAEGVRPSDRRRAEPDKNQGYVMPAWYDITSLGRGGADVAHVAETRRQITALLDRESERGVLSERIVLAGFSQGAGIALYTGLRHPRRLGGILVASGYELWPETLAQEVAPENFATPILFCHGLHDDLVPAAAGREAYEARVKEGRSAEWREFPISHEVSMPEIETIGAWLRSRLPASES